MAATVKRDLLQADAVQAALRTRYLGRSLHLVEQVGSTNTAAIALTQDGAVHGTVLVADTQTAGKGRLGRDWYSPAGEGLYCSIVLRPETEGPLLGRFWEYSSWIPLISAVAAARAIQTSTGLTARVKWPNDLLLDEHKVGGLLCESSAREPVSRSYLILGIGINVNTSQEHFPPELRDRATSLAIRAGRHIEKTGLLVALLQELEHALESLASARPEELIQSYTDYCATIGRRVRIDLGSESLEGRAESIALDGSLRVNRDGQEDQIVEVRAGDVIHVR
jgi:BirA family biotin operon repressor/biotin-[acetyl-CoA-carboxylase] ligase